MRIEEPAGSGGRRYVLSLRARLYCRSWLREAMSSAILLAYIWVAPFHQAKAGESELRISLQGKPELVYDPKRDACTPNDIPDVNARAFRAADGTVTLTALHFINRALRGPDLDHLRIDCAVILNSKQSPDPAEYDGRRFITALWSDDGTHVAALVHNEYHANHFAGRCASSEELPCWYNTILSFSSDDAGHTFTKSSPLVVAAPPFRQNLEQGRHRGFFNPSNIFALAAYKYALISTTGWNGQPYGACLFRNENPLNSAGWRAFDGSAFSIRYDDPYKRQTRAPGACAPIAPFGFPVGAVVRHRSSGMFIAVWEAPKNESDRPVDGFYAATSRNLIDWSAPRLILAGTTMMKAACGPDGSKRYGSVIAYPSILDSNADGRNFDNVGDDAWLYYAAVKVEDCTPGADRVLLRQKISIAAIAKQATKERRS
ncbi:MAG: hypothetical protein JOZ16_10675 [Methylobacteriaceae bacterium]|nr:hypothetical protein [Methylobacteriaceae bacterium]